MGILVLIYVKGQLVKLKNPTYAHRVERKASTKGNSTQSQWWLETFPRDW